VSPHAPPTPESAVETAMAQVLAAEAAARLSVSSAGVDAQHIAERARAAARELDERTQQRIQRLRAAFERTANAEVAALQAQAEALGQPHQTDADDARHVDLAVARLAARLTGAAP